MISSKISLRVGVVSLVLALGCAPSPKEVADQASADTKSLLSEALETARLTNGWASVDDFFVSAGFAPSAAQRARVPEATATNEGLDSVSKLADKLFAESNIVERPAGALVFALTGPIVCTDPRNNASTPSASCVKDVDALQLRVKVTAGLDFTLQVGPKHLEPLVLQLRSKKSIAVVVDLGPMKEVIDFVNATLSTSAPTNTWAVTGSGKVELKLQKNGAFDFTLSQSNLTGLEAKVTTGGLERSYTAAARSPVLALRVEGPAHKATATLDHARAEARFFAGDLSRSADGGFGTPVTFALSGLSAQGVVSEGGPFQLNNLGLGDGQSTVSTASGTVASVEVNASLGRHFAMTGQSISGGMRFELTPALDTTIFVGLAAVPEWKNVDVSFSNHTYTGSFKATSGTPTFEVLKRKPSSVYRQCTTDAACGTGYLCHPVLARCVAACEGASNCPSSAKTCATIDGVPGTTSSTNAFCQCSTDALCTSSMGSNALCQPTSKQCAQRCVRDDECGVSGQTCDTGTGRCRAGPVGYDAGVPWYGGLRLVNGDLSVSVSGPSGNESKQFKAVSCVVTGSSQSGQNALISSFTTATCPE